MKRTGFRGLPLAAAGLLAGIACGGGGGGSSNSPAAPAAPAGGGSTSGPATIRITSSGVSLKEVKIEIGSTVMFVNDDGRSHEMMSDPHPTHAACPPLNEVGNLAPGQSKRTGVFSENRTCGYHDNRLDGDASLRGTIVVGLGGEPPDRY